MKLILIISKKLVIIKNHQVMNNISRILKENNIPTVELILKPYKTISQQKILSSNDSNTILLQIWDENTLYHHESFKVLLLNNANQATGIVEISSGGINSCTVDVRFILQAAILSNSTAVILAHNHPSGILKPSELDIKLTNKVKEALNLCDIKLLDHIILSHESYYSFADDGMI